MGNYNGLRGGRQAALKINATNAAQREAKREAQEKLNAKIDAYFKKLGLNPKFAGQF